MNLTEIDPGDTIEFLRPINRGGGAPRLRSAGLHVSDIIRDLENRVTKPGKRRPVSDLSPSEKRRMGHYVEIGWAWEEMIRRAMLRSYYAGVNDRFCDPGELELDGIYGNPDWFDLEDACVEEFKATYRSSRRPIETDFWSWFVQIKAYCAMTATNWARLRVFFVNGNYRESGPQFRLWQIRFDEDEIERNWTMLRNHGLEMVSREGEEAGRGGVKI